MLKRTERSKKEDWQSCSAICPYRVPASSLGLHLGKGIGKARPYIETNLGKLIDAKGMTARYVRLHSGGNTANDLNHYIEVEVFGKPAS